MICKKCKIDKSEKKFYWSKVCLDCNYIDKLQKLKEAQEKKKTKMLENYAEKLEKKIERQTAIKSNKILKKLKGKEIKPSITKIKQKAYTECQLYAKLIRADKDWMVKLADTWQMCHYSKCVAWHIYSKHNNPHMAFFITNIRPITSETNRIQWTSPWIYWAVNVLNPYNLQQLKDLSEDKILKNQLRNSNYYQEKYEYYKWENEKLLKRFKS